MDIKADKDQNLQDPDRFPHDHIMLRAVTRSLIFSMYQRVYFYNIVDGQYILEQVPIYYSDSGSEQFARDFYLDIDRFDPRFKECPDLRPPAEGNTPKIPSGRLKMLSANPSNQSVPNRNERLKYKVVEKTQFGDNVVQKSSKGKFFPFNVNYECIIRCSSDLQRMEIMQNVFRIMYKKSKITYSIDGFPQINAQMALPESYGQDKQFQFGIGDDNTRPELTFNIEVLAYLPDMDFDSEQPFVNKTIGKDTSPPIIISG